VQVQVRELAQGLGEEAQALERVPAQALRLERQASELPLWEPRLWVFPLSP